tara:strand:+ start:125 stop:439 length:315 start_codon:yes stop_codon:yes gene_type:complete
MNLKRKIREELNKTLLMESDLCPATVEMFCMVGGMAGQQGSVSHTCTAWLCGGPSPQSPNSTEPCSYCSCCQQGGMPRTDDVKSEPRGETMGESRGYRSHRTRR